MPLHRALRLGKEKAKQMFSAYGEKVIIKNYLGEEILSIDEKETKLLGKVIYDN
jgi:hypothetical protein